MPKAPPALFRPEIPTLLRLLSGEGACLDAFHREGDWRPFAEACDDHQVSTFAYCRLQSISKNTPPGLLDHLRQRFYEISARNYRLAKKLVDLTVLLQNEGIPTLAFKGPALAMAVYGDLVLRQYKDLDLVIHKEHLVKAVDLMTRSGFQLAPTFSRPQITPYLCNPRNPRHVARAEEIPFRAPDGTYYVDIHWKLGHDFWRPFSPDIDKVWERIEKQDLPQGSVSTFCREDLFLALCYHGTKHRWLALKWLLDVAELLRKAGTFDWSRVEEMTRIQPGLVASAGVAIWLANQLLDAPVPSEAGRILPATNRTLALAAAIRDEILTSGRSTRDSCATLLELEPRPLARMKFRATRIVRYPGSVLSEVFVYVDSKDRACISLPPRFRFLYHVIRPVRLLARHSMRAARALRSMVG
jgi:hypothetical protein